MANVATGPVCDNYFGCYAGAVAAQTTVNPGGAATLVPIVSTTIAKSKVPCYPSTTGECDVSVTPFVGNANTGLGTVGAYEATPYSNPSKKYQYWAVKVKPYLETQFSLQNKIYVDRLL